MRKKLWTHLEGTGVNRYTSTKMKIIIHILKTEKTNVIEERDRGA